MLLCFLSLFFSRFILFHCKRTKERSTKDKTRNEMCCGACFFFFVRAVHFVFILILIRFVFMLRLQWMKRSVKRSTKRIKLNKHTPEKKIESVVRLCVFFVVPHSVCEKEAKRNKACISLPLCLFPSFTHHILQSYPSYSWFCPLATVSLSQRWKREKETKKKETKWNIMKWKGKERKHDFISLSSFFSFLFSSLFCFI